MRKRETQKLQIKTQKGLEDLQELIIELTKEKPNQNILSTFAKNYGFSCSGDPDQLIKDIIFYLNLLKSKENKTLDL